MPPCSLGFSFDKGAGHLQSPPQPPAITRPSHQTQGCTPERSAAPKPHRLPFPGFTGPLGMQVSSARKSINKARFKSCPRGAGARSQVSGRESQLPAGISTWPQKATGRHGRCLAFVGGTGGGCHRGSEARPPGLAERFPAPLRTESEKKAPLPCPRRGRPERT